MDIQLVVRAQAGDVDAFSQLATTIADQLHRVAYNILRDRELSADATQQALLSMWQSLPQLRDPARFEAWAYRTVVRACYAETRRSKRWLTALTTLGTQRSNDRDEIREVEDRDAFDRALRELSIDHRTVLVLRFNLDMKIDDIAALLDIPVGTARSRLSRAMEKLRAAMTLEDPRTGQPLQTRADR